MPSVKVSSLDGLDDWINRMVAENGLQKTDLMLESIKSIAKPFGLTVVDSGIFEPIPKIDSGMIYSGAHHMQVGQKFTEVVSVDYDEVTPVDPDSGDIRADYTAAREFNVVLTSHSSFGTPFVINLIYKDDDATVLNIKNAEKLDHFDLSYEYAHRWNELSMALGELLAN